MFNMNRFTLGFFDIIEAIAFVMCVFVFQLLNFVLKINEKPNRAVMIN